MNLKENKEELNQLQDTLLKTVSAFIAQMKQNEQYTDAKKVLQKAIEDFPSFHQRKISQYKPKRTSKIQKVNQKKAELVDQSIYNESESYFQGEQSIPFAINVQVQIEQLQSEPDFLQFNENNNPFLDDDIGQEMIEKDHCYLCYDNLKFKEVINNSTNRYYRFKSYLLQGCRINGLQLGQKYKVDNSKHVHDKCLSSLIGGTNYNYSQENFLNKICSICNQNGAFLKYPICKYWYHLPCLMQVKQTDNQRCQCGCIQKQQPQVRKNKKESKSDNIDNIFNYMDLFKYIIHE